MDDTSANNGSPVSVANLRAYQTGPFSYATSDDSRSNSSSVGEEQSYVCSSSMGNSSREERPCGRSIPRGEPNKSTLLPQEQTLHGGGAGTKKKQKKRLVSRPSFPKAELDWSFLKEGKLYGREAELEELQRVFRRRVDSNGSCGALEGISTKPLEVVRPELVLVSGKSGTGKTILVKRALKQLVEDDGHGFFLVGKFDQLQTPEPYGPVVAALTQLVVSLEQHNPGKQILGLRNIILSGVGLENCQVICALVPAFARLLGLDHSSERGDSPLKIHEAHRDRLKNALASFFRIFCALPAKKVVLLLDDLQWADTRSLDLLEALVSDKTIVGLVLVGVCRDNEVPWEHDFANMLRRLEDEMDTKITHIQLTGLPAKATKALLSDILRQPSNLCDALANLIHEKSEGNAFFILHYLKALYEEGVLVAVRGVGFNDYQWLWYSKKWDDAFPTEFNVVDLLARQIQQLDQNCQTVLKTAACMGAEFDKTNLAMVLGDGVDPVDKALNVAIHHSLIVEQMHQEGRLSFAHDQIQKAAYSLIQDEDRPAAHLAIGRSLLQQLTSSELDANLFLVVNQLCYGASLLNTEVDKNGLADLCVKAGVKASVSSDFQTAIMYFDVAKGLLSQRHWRDEYYISLELYSARAEAECCSESFEDMDKTMDELLKNCRAPKDKMRPLLTKIYSLGARCRYSDAMDLGFQVLASLGERFPSKPNILYLIPEFLGIKRRLRKMSDQDIMDLPKIDHEDKIMMTAMSILNLLQVYAFCADPDMFPFLVLRFIKLTLKYGQSDMSCLAFASYGVILCAVDESEEGYRYGRLGLRLLERCTHNRARLMPRLHFTVYGMLSPWKVPLRSTLKPLQQVIPDSLVSGDFECSLFASYTFVVTSLAAGTVLPVVEDQANTAIKLLSQRKRQGPWLELTLLVQNFVHNFMGKTEDPLALKLTMDANSSAKHEFLIYDTVARTFRLELAYHFGDIELALQYSTCERKTKEVMKTSFVCMYFHLFRGLTHLEAAHHGKRRYHRAKGRKAIKKFEKIADQCPENVLHKLYLLKGDLKALDGDLPGALAYYECAIRCASREGFICLRAIAHERSAMAIQRLSKAPNAEHEAKTHILTAISLYEQWGGLALVANLKQRHNL